MIIDLTESTSSEIASALLQARRHAGSVAMGLVGTLIVATSEARCAEAALAANTAAREHPHRALIVVPQRRSKRAAASSRVDAEVRVGEGIQGESVLLRLHGEVIEHAASVVLPLLLPDSPVVVWWPDGGPDSPARDPLGALGQRRITDAAADRKAYQGYAARAAGYEPGDTDLAWTRLTPWRGLLAAALDQYPTPVESVQIRSRRGNASAELLAAWLQDRLAADVELHGSRGPGITEVRLHTNTGDLLLRRDDGRVATFTVPAQPDRLVALSRRSAAELLGEELRRLDPDDVYAETLETWIRRRGEPKAAGVVARKAATQRAGRGHRWPSSEQGDTGRTTAKQAARKTKAKAKAKAKNKGSIKQASKGSTKPAPRKAAAKRTGASGS